ncbi:chemotaxis protein [Sphingomonas sp. JC676]|uniref:methyl-accepting chemotaxis protein n=1 Tax=Sphingomonas sp. JC676 TaxID=2768065 RepID=UPI0016578C36|nr:methyl-accepting chemotaxis protein [Sphingomonas sp. JC676]MBC9034940.1 chemotaxis protein [Sphingomonas sp. JC676]
MISDIDRLRLRGIDLLVASAWAAVVLLFLLGICLGGDRPLVVAMLGIAANIVPTLMMLRRRHDATARLVIGSLAAIHPALMVYALAGHGWQMDAHMYFFVALAALTVLCDWRPMALASALIAVHHLVLDILVPSWVFAGGGDFGRVIFHAVAVSMQFAVLSYISIWLTQLMRAQAEARGASERLAQAADARRDEIEAAMAAMRAAETREREERARRETLERDTAAARRRETLAVAAAFQASVADVVGAVTQSAGDLDRSAHALNDLARRASGELSETARIASHASNTAASLATDVHDLSASILAIASSVDQQARLSDDARNVSASGESAVHALSGQAGSIGDFAQSIHEIAARTNLLALNATIEAARAGDVGRGFAVVAHEVKQLAGQASGATEQIRSLVGTVAGGVTVAHDALAEIAATVAEVAGAAEAIRLEVDRQRHSARAIEGTARDTAQGAIEMADRIGAVAAVAGDTEHLSGRVSDAATTLSHTARALQQATEHFVEQLHAA